HYDPVRAALDSYPPPPPPVPSTSSPASAAAAPAPAVNVTIPSTLSGSFTSPPNTATSPPRTVFRASASPAISSIIDPPAPTMAAVSLAPPPPTALLPQNMTNLPIHNSPARPEASMEPPKPAEERSLGPARLQELVPMDIDNKQQPPPVPTTAIAQKSSATPKKDKATASPNTPASGAQSPKPGARSKEAAPRTTGSGLLTSAVFGLDMNSSASTAKTVPNIIVHVPLQGQTNVIFNFARLAEEQYGFDALHPRIAAQRERRARLAAASAALARNEKNRGESGAEDDLSLDVDRDSDGDGDIAMSGTGPASEAAAGAAKGRRKKMEDYDRDDPFVDDSELVWEEQAAASKDGFFVYSGPLVPEGQTPSVERSVNILIVLFITLFLTPDNYRADGTVKRGRGRGGRAAAGESRAAAASRTGRKDGAKDKDSKDDGPAKEKPRSGRGGAGATRKPRMTKADRLLMEKEKAEREKLGMGLAGKNGVAVGAK
ncbi:HIR complex subunit, partial [Ophidiomyces ophidiicola]